MVLQGNLVFYTPGHSIYIHFLQAEGKPVPGSQSGLISDNQNKKLGEKLPQNQLWELSGTKPRGSLELISFSGQRAVTVSLESAGWRCRVIKKERER